MPGPFNINDTAGGGAVLRAVTQTLLAPTSFDFNINSDAGGGQVLRDANRDLPDGTTLYFWHSLIEASPTSNTVVSVFGHLWDGDADAEASVSPDLLHSNLLRSHLLTGLAR